MLDLFPGYVIDTSALIDLWRGCPRDVYPDLRPQIESLIASGDLIAPQEVLAELEVQRDELYEWAKQQSLFVDLDDDQIRLARSILKRFPKLVDEKKTTPDADPFVVALALSRGWKVVSSEKGHGSGATIPDVCTHYEVQCLRLLDFFRDRKWTFHVTTRSTECS